MKPTLKTRKPIDELTLSDFVTFPIWTYASDEESVEGQDETTVKPLRNIRSASSGEPIHVSCDFLFGGGQVFSGFTTVCRDSWNPSGAVVLKHRKYLFLPPELKKKKGKYFDQSAVTRLCKELGLTVDEVDHVVVRLNLLEKGVRHPRAFYLYE